MHGLQGQSQFVLQGQVVGLDVVWGLPGCLFTRQAAVFSDFSKDLGSGISKTLAPVSSGSLLIFSFSIVPDALRPHVLLLPPCSSVRGNFQARILEGVCYLLVLQDVLAPVMEPAFSALAGGIFASEPSGKPFLLLAIIIKLPGRSPHSQDSDWNDHLFLSAVHFKQTGYFNFFLLFAQSLGWHFSGVRGRHP